MPVHGVFLTRIFPFEDKIFDISRVIIEETATLNIASSCIWIVTFGFQAQVHNNWATRF